MSRMLLSTQINAPIDQVFDAFSDFQKAEENVDAIVRVEMLTDDPVRTGTRFKETRVMFGRESTEEMEVTAFEPNRLITVSADTCGSRFDSTFRFKTQQNGTHVEMEMLTQAKTLMARLMWPLGMLMMGSMKKMMQSDMDQIKVVCEKAHSVA